MFKDFSPNSVSTLQGSYGRNKGRCLVRVLHLGRGIFPVNTRIKLLLWDAHVHFDCAGSHKLCGTSFASSLGCGIFPNNCHIKLLFWHVMKSWNVQRILTAQARTKRGANFWGAAFSCQYSHKIALVRCPCAFWLRRLARALRHEFCFILGRGIFRDNCHIKLLFWHATKSRNVQRISTAQASTKRGA